MSLGRGDSSPGPFHTYHILGSSRHTVYPYSLYLRHAGFSTIFSVFRPFSPIFSPFSAFLAPWPHLPGGTRSRDTETGAGNHKTPWVGAKKNHAPGGVAGCVQHSAGAGDGLAPPSQGRSAAQRQRGGTHRVPPLAAAGGGDRRERAATGSRAAQRRGRPADEAGPRRGGTPCPRKRAALCADRPPTADAPRGCAARGKRVGVVAPPQSAELAGPNAATPPRDGGARPHPAPRCRFARAQQTTHWPPGPRWQMAGLRRD